MPAASSDTDALSAKDEELASCDEGVECLAAWVDGLPCLHGRPPQSALDGGEVLGQATTDPPADDSADDSADASPEVADPPPADTDLVATDEMKYNDLVAELKSRGLPTDGKKPELAQRLREAIL